MKYLLTVEQEDGTDAVFSAPTFEMIEEQYGAWARANNQPV